MSSPVPLYQQISEHFQPLGQIEALVLTSFGLDVRYLERSILPAFFPNLGDGPADEPHRPLFEYLEDEQVPISVMYDASQLISAQKSVGAQAAVTKELRWQAFPIGKASGCFHPKLVLAVVNNGEERSLVIGCGSANLTQSGWGRNFEAFSLETLSLKVGIKNSLLSDIRDWLVEYSELASSSEAISIIRSAVETADPQAFGTRVQNNEYRSRLWFGQNRQNLGEWLRTQVLRGDIRSGDWKLEVLSPYISQDIPQLLTWADKRINEQSVDEPGKILCYCPQKDGAVDLEPEVLRAYTLLENVVWADMVGESLKSRLKDEQGNALTRYLHAKVYRFYTNDLEVLVVGSANATVQGHQDQLPGNDEACLVFSRTASKGITFKPWLKALTKPPVEDDCAAQPSTAEDSGQSVIMPLVRAQFDWQSKILTMTNAGKGTAFIYLGIGHPYEVGSGEVQSQVVDEKLSSSLFRNPAVKLRTPDYPDHYWVCLVEELNLHHKPPAPSMERSVDDLIRDWQVGIDQRMAERVARESLPQDLRSSSAYTSPELDESAIQDRLNDLFLAVHRFQSEIESKLSAEEPTAYAINQVRSRLLGRGAMSVRYFVEKVVAAVTTKESNLEKLSAVEGYVAILSVLQALKAISEIAGREMQQGLQALMGEFDAPRLKLRRAVESELKLEKSQISPEALLSWVEDNVSYSRSLRGVA